VRVFNGEMTSVSCNLCGSTRSELVFIKDSLCIVKCKKCGLVYVNPRLTKNKLREFNEEKFTVEKWIKNPQSQVNHFKARLEGIESLKRPGRLLDIGCAPGFSLIAAKEEGWETFGVEICSSLADYARKKLGLNVFTGELHELRFSKNYFDVITIWETIEHLEDPLSELYEANRLLNPDGLLAISTPNISSLAARIYGRNWYDIHPQDHLYYFSPRTIKIMLEKAGFKVVKLHTFVFSLNPPSSLVRMGSKASKSSYLALPAKAVKRLTVLFIEKCTLLGDRMLIYARKTTS